MENVKINASRLYRVGFQDCYSELTFEYVRFTLNNFDPKKILNVYKKNIVKYNHAIGGDIDTILYVVKYRNSKNRHCWATVYDGVTYQISDFEIFCTMWDLECNNELGFVYFLESKYGYKIGSAKNIHNRTRMFGVLLPFPTQIRKFILSENYKILEKEYQQKFNDKKINGEWYSLTENDLSVF